MVGLYRVKRPAKLWCVAGFRSYYPQGGLKPGAAAELDANESRHLTKALRARPGDSVTLFDGRGEAWEGRVETAGRHTTVLIETVCTVRPPLPIFLAVAMLKGKAMDAVIRAAVELGAAGVIPLESERTEVRLDADRAENKVGHWQTVAIEAAKQSGNLAGLDIPPPRPLDSWLGGVEGLKLVASLSPGAKPLLNALEERPVRATLLIGPEGDFSPAEYQRIAKAGFLAVSLGSHVLRAETAAAYALSVMHAALWPGD